MKSLFIILEGMNVQNVVGLVISEIIGSFIGVVFDCEDWIFSMFYIEFIYGFNKDFVM